MMGRAIWRMRTGRRSAASVDQLLKLLELVKDQHFTEPPPRYTEATLVRSKNGIDRPSTRRHHLDHQGPGLRRDSATPLHPYRTGLYCDGPVVKHFPAFWMSTSRRR